MFVPANVKSPFQDWALLLESVIAPPLVLSIVPPPIVKAPDPTAVALLILSCPALQRCSAAERVGPAQGQRAVSGFREALRRR